MKKIIMILMIAIGVSSLAYGQTKMSKDSNEAQIIALEKASWAAWQKKDGSWFQNNLADDWLLVNSFELETKKEIVEGIMTDCEVKSFSFDDFRFVMLSKDSARLTYHATQDAACEGNALPKSVRATAVYVKRGGKWLQSLYMETAVADQNNAMQNEKPETFALRPAVEKEYGYIHAMRIGDDLKISGAVSMDDKGILIAPGNLEQQMKNCYADLEKILKHFGYTFDDVTVENVFTTDMAGFINVSGYRNSIYKNGFPTGTWLEVKGLALPGQLIEIDMEAHKSK